MCSIMISKLVKIQVDNVLQIFCTEPEYPNNGKACILKDSIRLLGELFTRVDSLKKEHTTLLSESNYVSSLKALLSCNFRGLHNISRVLLLMWLLKFCLSFLYFILVADRS